MACFHHSPAQVNSKGMMILAILVLKCVCSCYANRIWCR